MKMIEFTLANLFILSLLDWIVASVFQINISSTVIDGKVNTELATVCLAAAMAVMYQASLLTIRGYQKLCQVLISQHQSRYSQKSANAHPATEAILERVDRKFNNFG